jgi:hypothetical protein
MLTLALFFTEASRRWAGPHEEDGGGGGSQAEEGQGLDAGVRRVRDGPGSPHGHCGS